jgi:CRP-like cAMP-binding protein
MNQPLMNFKPRLRPGRMTPHGSKFTFKIEDPIEQITLPMIMADFILLCSGQYTLRAIVEKMYRKQGAVPFRSILETLYTLHTRGFLENSHELPEQSWLLKQQMTSRNLFRDIRFQARLLGPGQMPALFYLFTLAAVIVSGFEIIDQWVEPFSTPYSPTLLASTCLKLFVLNSLLLTGKHLIRAAQILSLKGWVEDLSIRIAPWGIHLRATDYPTDLTQNRLFQGLFHLSQILVPFSFVLLARAIPGYDPAQLFALASLGVFWELNPFRRTDFFDLLRALFVPHQLDSLTFVGTGLNPRNQRFILICSIFGLAWIGFGVKLLEACAEKNTSVLTLAFSQGGFSGAVGAALSFMFWFGALFFMVHAFVETSAVVMAQQTRVWRTRLMRKFEIADFVYSNAKVIDKLRHLPLFTHLSDEGLEKLTEGSKLIWIERGTNIILSGEESTDLYVLFEGAVAIEKGKQSASILPVTIFGESALLNKGTRSANVVAIEKSLCLRIPIAHLRNIARESHVLGEIESFMTAIMVDQFFASSPLFRKLSREGVEFLSSRGALDYVAAGQTVFEQGDMGEYFYMVIRGSVNVAVNGTMMKTIPQGGFFGEISLIANIPRTATISAAEPAVLFKISADAFWEVLLQHIEMAIFIESVGEQRLQEDLQLMQTNKAG